MNSQKWEALITAIDLGSFTRAAERLGYTQSGLTHMMRSLETELGFSVLHRGSFGVRPTEECERILPRVRALLAADRALEAEIGRVREDEHIRVGVCPTVAAPLLPSALVLFRREFPKVTIEIEEASEAMLREGLGTRFDLILIGDGDAYGDRLIPLTEEALLALLPEGDPRCARERLPLRELSGGELLLSDAAIDATRLSEQGISFREGTRLTVATLISMVAHGLGVGLLPAFSLSRELRGVRALPTEPPLCRRTGIVVAEERPRHDAVRRFVSIVKKAAESLGTEV